MRWRARFLSDMLFIFLKNAYLYLKSTPNHTLLTGLSLRAKPDMARFVNPRLGKSWEIKGGGWGGKGLWWRGVSAELFSIFCNQPWVLAREKGSNKL